MSKSSTATVNTALTSFASGVAQDVRSALADFIAPPVPVGVTDGHYKKFDEKNTFRVYNAKRGIGGAATRIHMDAEDPTFSCAPYALEAAIDDIERQKAGEFQQALEEAKIREVIVGASLSHEDEVLAKAKSITATSKTWGASADPIDDIDQAILDIVTATGMFPNRMVLGPGIWKLLKNHKNVVSRQRSTTDKAVDLGGFASMLLNPNIEIRLGLLSKDTAKEGKAASKQNIIGSDILIFVGSQNPTTFDPSFMKTFRVGDISTGNVTEYRDETCSSDIYKVAWSNDIKVVSSICAKRLSVSAS